MMDRHINALDHVPHCYTYDDGLVIAGIVAHHLRQRDQPILSFKGVTDVTPSFVNGSFVNLVSDFSATQLRQHLHVVDSTAQINSLIRSRVQDVAKNVTSGNDTVSTARD